MNGGVVDRVLNMAPDERRSLFTRLPDEHRMGLLRLLEARVDNPFLAYEKDPVGFVEQALHESVWSKQREILESVRDNKRTAVPACHAPGKSHIAARAVAWWVNAHPPGTAIAVTTATTFRQVRNILWPHIRRVQSRHNLLGSTSQTEWRIGDELAAYGFSSGDHDEAAVQGVHAPHLLIVVDEAGGIGDGLGQALEALMTGDHTRLLVIGNPATDQEASWFERCCHSDLFNVIPIPADATPNFTGEDSGLCQSCPAGTPAHPVSQHLVDQQWVADVTGEFGDDSAFVQARVHARFPRSTANKVIPLAWCEAAAEAERCDEGPIRLGVDVASDGGDEFAIAWADGMHVSIKYKASGDANHNAVDVARMVLGQIKDAEKVHRDRGYTEPVRVKVDALGVGWGIVSQLDRWRDEGKHSAVVVDVKVSERARDATKFGNQRAELWWTGRLLLQPVEGQDGPALSLDVDRRTLAQLAGPKYKSDSAGRIMIERKIDMKRRGVPSPDRAEAVLLAVFEPPARRKAAAVVADGSKQTNAWRIG